MENIFFNPSDLKYCGKNVIIGKSVRIRRPELVSIDEGSIIDDFTYISGELQVGKFVHIASGCALQARGSKIIMKDFSALAAGVKVFATTANYINCSFDSATIPREIAYGSIQEEVVLDDFVWIGANSVILPGCHFPVGFVAGALSKLTKNLPYKAWHILVDDKSGESVRRIGVDKLISAANLLLNKKVK
jgi:acetyltransferase-like isoleucine patch superfamily enzyme